MSKGEQLIHTLIFHEHRVGWSRGAKEDTSAHNQEATDARIALSKYVADLEAQGDNRFKHEMEMGDFHETAGWFFKRLPDGSVRIRVNGYGEHVIPPMSWASVIAHVAPGGEAAKWFEACAFHEARPRPADDRL